MKILSNILLLPAGRDWLQNLIFFLYLDLNSFYFLFYSAYGIEYKLKTNHC